ncbi:MAG: hypothetical protein ACTSQJ_09065 [Promethearchaeota archaeon]
MGFVESIILLFMLGWLSSYLYKKYLRKKNKDWLAFLSIIILISFWIIDITIYFGIFKIIWINNIPWVKIPDNDLSGSYFMWNSFILFGIDFKISPEPGMISIAILIFISYPLWFNLGVKLGRILHGYYEHEEGILWILKSGKKHYD